jgi:lipoprotein-anchoring transpeptidase ErfK/SrfK
MADTGILMNTETITAAQAVNMALQALRRGDQPSTRRWAQRAAALDPGAAEAWLILARVASPRAQMAYLEQARKARPANTLAVETLQRAPKSQLIRTKEAAMVTTQPVQKSAAGEKPAEGSVERGLAPLTVVFLVTLLVAAAVFWFALPMGVPRIMALVSGWSSAHTGQSASQQGGVAEAAHLESPTPTTTKFPTATYTPFAAVTNTPTSTPTPLPTATFTPTPLPPPTDTPVPQRPANAARHSGKSIVVSISEQHVYAYEGDHLVLSFVASTGRGGTTLAGNFKVLDKIPNAWSAPWGFWMPNWMGIYWVGSNLENGFHSLPVLYNGKKLWGNEIGTPITYGCVVLQPGDMKQLFDWAEIGTPIQIVH